ncbi:hypothetical protein C0J52_08628 [Blattella germanica]|nr:hypothetical protein C0J52_08628 [Blattella germanica]
MGLYERERQLSILAGASACLCIISITCSGVPWGHWKEVLDTCMTASCECILYGTQYFREFAGGNTSVCYFTTLAPVPVLIIAVFLAGYHGYRVCMYGRRMERRPRRNGDVAVVQRDEEDRSPGFVWLILLVVIASSVCILLIIASVILTDGYYATCSEYRRGLSRNTQVTGLMAAAINGRLTCGAIYDFMDYLEPVHRPFIRKEYVNYNRPHEEKDSERGGFINTGHSLQTAIGTYWINSCTWIVIIILYGLIAFSKCRSK